MFESNHHRRCGACELPYYVGNFNDDYRRMIARTRTQFDKMDALTHAIEAYLSRFANPLTDKE